MKRELDNYDFAGSRGSSSLSSIASGNTGGVSASRWRAAKAKQVGGKRKRCRKGKNCSAACITTKDMCIVELPGPVQSEVARMAAYLLKKNKVRPGSLTDKRLAAGLMQMAPLLTSTDGPKETSGKGAERVTKSGVGFDTRGVRKAERAELTWKEIQGLKERRDLLNSAEVRDDAMKLLQRDAFSRGLHLPKQELEMMFDALPKATQVSLMSSGRPKGKDWWSGKDEAGNDVFSKGANKERGVAVLDMWFKQGGTDAYQGRGGKIRAPQELDVEHVRPLSKGGQDTPSNWVLARAGAQRKRQNENIGTWIDKLPKTPEEQSRYLSTLRSTKNRKAVTKAAQKALDPKQFSDQEVFAWGAAKAGRAFGLKSLFTGEFQPIGNVSKGAGRPNSGPPLPFAKGIALVAKTRGADEARKLTYQLRDVWNKRLMTNQSITPKQAFAEMKQLVSRNLTPEQQQMFNNTADNWAQSRDVRGYGF